MPWDNAIGLQIGPWWFRVTVGPYGNGWTLYIARRRIAWKPIDYSKAPVVNGVRKWGYPKTARLDLRKQGAM